MFARRPAITIRTGSHPSHKYSPERKDWKHMTQIKHAAALCAFFAATLATGLAHADTYSKMVGDGKLVVGVKTDYVPWGMRDAQGNIVGYEVDIVKDLAQQMSKKAGKPIEVDLVPVTTPNRMDFLQQGRVDVVIATMADTPDRRKLIGFITPAYYSSGASVLAKKASSLDGWASVRGKTLCSIQGGWYVKDPGQSNGAEVLTFKGVPEIESALLAGRCSGWLYDTSGLISKKITESQKYSDYELAAPDYGDVPWAIGVRKEDTEAALGKALKEGIIEMHKSGRFLSLLKKWNMPEAASLVKMKEKCLANDPACN